ncbi:MAG: MarR family transcriptional regulator [Eggerthellaceae bacterium]|nr:MarR family transcriptional regulator [Eggerthellaceae bacterium]
MKHESIALSRQMMTVILEHVRIVKEHLRCNATITYNDFLVLLALQEAGEPVGAETLADYAILQRGTVAAMLQEMQKAGLVARTSSEDDGRVMLYSITREGSAVARQCSADLSAKLDEGILLGLDQGEAGKAIRGSIRGACDHLRGHRHGMAIEGGWLPNPICADYLLYWRAITEKWTSVAAEHGLALGEYRMLEYLDEFGTASTGDLACRLGIKQSNVSLYKRRLLERGLLHEAMDPFDGRKVAVRSTKEGAAVFSRARKSMNIVAQQGHKALADADIMTMNVWYMQMYLNLWRS